MSTTTVFLFVEGHEHDPYFYGGICDPVLSARDISYEIVGGWRLNESGGKKVLIEFFKYLSSTNSLSGAFKGKASIAIFFLDKDLDDVFNLRTRSDHVIYTRHYCVENHLFVDGDLTEAVAAASSFEKRIVAAQIGTNADWRTRSAIAWKEWVTFCLFAQRYDVSAQSNYRRSFSVINKPLYAEADSESITQYKNELQVRSGMTIERFERAFKGVCRLVDRLYARGHYDSIFSGKWYVALLEAEIERLAAGRPYNAHGIGSRILGSIVATVDFSGPWCEHFRTPLRALIEALL